MAINSKTGAVIGGKTNESWIKDYRQKHGDKYEYPNNSYKSTEYFEVLCKLHGLFRTTPSNHRAGRGCPSCANLDRANKQVKTQEQVLSDFIKKHGDKYDYSLINYINARTKVKILCKQHLIFEQTPNDHLNGKGCPKCSRENHRGSWTNTSWETSAKHSIDFDSYKIYVLHFFNEKEEFIKIGKTFRTIKKRMEGKNKIPYSYSEITVINFESARECSQIEIDLHKEFNAYSYKPLVKFGGMHECYKIDALPLIKEKLNAD